MLVQYFCSIYTIFSIICLTAYLTFQLFIDWRMTVLSHSFWSLSLVRWELPLGHFFPIKSAECFSYDSGFSLYTLCLDHTLCSLQLMTVSELNLYFRFSCTLDLIDKVICLWVFSGLPLLRNSLPVVVLLFKAGSNWSFRHVPNWTRLQWSV
jgi:hypothetical protein